MGRGGGGGDCEICVGPRSVFFPADLKIQKLKILQWWRKKISLV